MQFMAVSILERYRPALAGLIIGAAAFTAGAGFAPAQSAETLLYRFKGGTDGSTPVANLIFDSKGALYGSTYAGGTLGYGTVFKLTPPAPGHPQWTETVLYSFKGGSDGTNPQAGLIIEKNGALYGTTVIGGSKNSGTVFKLTPPDVGHSQWTETIVHSFDGNDGGNPSGLIFDSKGALYGTTFAGGTLGYGTVFKLTPPTPGHPQWTETVLYRFKGGSDGATPPAGLVFDSNGALYGATFVGGSKNSGTVFKLTPPDAGHSQWTESVLHSFGNENDGASPYAGLIIDRSGALYGTTVRGVFFDRGTVFKLTPPAAGHTQWSESVLYSFKVGPDGSMPEANLIFDSKGALYGTTFEGGTLGYGTVFKLTPPAPGHTQWSETLLHLFVASPSDGQLPQAGLILDSKGTLYGTTAFGGTSNCHFGTCFYGTVFEVH
jgi:uncharacterized repeat protein (TIGR03803 family)